MDQSLTQVMRSIGVALKLDDNNHSQNAYIQYLECVLSISSNLLQYVRSDGGKIIVTMAVKKQVQLGIQCMDRLSSLIEEFSQFSQHREAHTPVQSPNESDKGSIGEKKISRFAAPVPPLHSHESETDYSLKRSLTPTEVAYHQNQSIMRAYKTRMEKMSRRHPQAASLSLTVQRKMAENLAIANAQEKALSEKMRETQRRLDEQAAKRFASPVGMSEDEQEQRKIYKKILEYEQQAKWLNDWRLKLSRSPKDPVVISQMISVILRCKDHPLTQLLKKYQYKIYERLYPLVANKISEINEICVPLPNNLHPKSDIDVTSDTECKNKDLGEKTDKNKYCNQDMCEINNSGGDDSNEHCNETHEDGNDLVSGTENVKSNIEEALEQNEKLCQNLRNENEITDSMYKSLSKECENYIDEDMDDLYEEQEDTKPECDIWNKVERPGNSDSYVVLSVKDVNQSTKSTDNLFNFKCKSSGSENVENLAAEAYCRHLKDISQDVHHALEKMLVMFAIGYEELASPEGQDQCYASIEEPFFKPIWKYLLTLFRLSNRKQEMALALSMTNKKNTSPEEMGVAKKLCVIGNTEDDLPFISAINELCALKDHYTMLSKLECVVNVCRLICESVEDFYTAKQIKDGEISSTPSVGADDLLPILSYVLIQSALPQLVSECQAMAEFIHEGYIMGEEGYCLTSLQTAISFVSSSAAANEQD